MKATLWILPLLIALTSCWAPEGEPPERDGVALGVSDAAVPPAVVVDSIVPIDVALERFREGLERPTALGSGAETLDLLVDGIMEALEAADTLAFEDLTVSQAEYAWLYYPTTLIARPPYELPPALAWLQLQVGNRKGVLRARRDLGGRDSGYQGYRCGGEPTVEGVEGENRIWTACAVTLARNGGEQPVAIKLFAAVLERAGRFAVLSFDNDF